MRDFLIGGRGYQEYESQRRRAQLLKSGINVSQADFEADFTRLFVLYLIQGVPLHVIGQDGNRVMTARRSSRQKP